MHSDKAVLSHTTALAVATQDARIVRGKVFALKADAVTLEGEVDTWTQRYDAESSIGHLGGVRGVTNNIAVKSRAVDLAQVRTSIEDAVRRRAEREADRIMISYRDGIVTLSGSVKNWGERHAIEQAAGYAPGVRRVNSQLTVDPYA